MKNIIPKLIYRGDNDFKKRRLLKSTLHHYQLNTNLINGGSGREINEKPLLELIDKHVDNGWENTHFLSFSESEKTAFRFGLNCELEEVDRTSEEYVEYYDSETDWDFALITVDTDKISINQIDQGVYEGYFQPILNEFRNFDKYRILLFDVVECLANYNGYENSKNNSKRDQEWLILPATQKQLNFGIEYSAILDGGCIYEIKKFKKY